MHPQAVFLPTWEFVRRSWLGLAYGIVLISTYLVTTTVTATQWDSISEHISTNVHNMSEHPIAVMVASALVVDGSLLMWGTLAVVSLIVVQRWIGAKWALLFAFLGNAIPTLITMASINYGLAVGWYDQSIRTTDDYGVSYVVATLLGALFWRIPSYKWRAAYLVLGFLWLTTMGLFQIPENFTALGHVMGYVVGLGLGALAVKYLTRPTTAERSVDDARAETHGDRLLGVRDYQDA